MKIEIDKDSLFKSVTIADAIIPSKSVNTILGNCLFKVSKDDIEIISTDNEIAIRTRVDAVADGEFSFTLNGKRLSQILKELPKGEITLNVDDSYVTNITSKSKEIHGEYKIIGTASTDYPEIPEISKKHSVTIDQAVFKEMIRKVMFAAATDSIKPVFNGIYFVSEESKYLTAVASDSRRLSKIRRPIENIIDMQEGIVIPLKTMHEVFRLLQNGECVFALQGNQCFFKINNTEIISRLIDGQFPNYTQVIPKDYQSTAYISTKKILETLRRVMVFTREPSYKILLTFKKDKIFIEAKTAELGEAKEELLIEMNNEDELLLGINAQYIIDVIREIDAQGIQVGLTGQMSPVTITPEDDDEFVSVIMPIQIKS